MENVVEIKNVYKNFKQNNVLNGLDLTVKKGQVYALLGHNGAGKTTTLRTILGLVKPTSGTVGVFGLDPMSVGEEIRARTGVLSEDVGLYENLTVHDNLRFFAETFKCTHYEKEIDELLNLFEIYDKKHSKINNFSLGMKKKVAIIRTFIHKPELILLDEPVNGLDPISIQKFHSLILSYINEYNSTFILTTHNLDEVQKICDEISIIKKGKSIINRNLKTGDLSGDLRTEIFCENVITENLIPSITNVAKKLRSDLSCEFSNDLTGDKKIILGTADKNLVAGFLREISLVGVSFYEVSREKFNLEQIYLMTETEQNPAAKGVEI